MRAIDLRPGPEGHAAPVTDVAFRPDGKRLATCSYDGTVLLWDVTAPARPRPLTRLHHRRLVNTARWNTVRPDVLATASADKTVAVWRIPEHPDTRRPELITVLARHTDDVNAVAWMPDGHRLICVSEDGRATLWDTRTGTFEGEVGSHTAHCMMVSVSRDGLVATVGEDGLIAVRDPDRPDRAAEYRSTASVEGCAWSHDGRTLAITRDDGVAELLTPRLAVRRSVTVAGTAARAVAWAEDDSSFVVGAYDGCLHVFDADGTRRHRFGDPRMWPRSVTVAPGGVAAVGSFWNGPHLVDLTTATSLSEPTAPNHGPNAMAVLGGELLVGCDSGTVIAFDPDRDGPERPRLLPVSDSPVLSLTTCGPDFYAGTYAGYVHRCNDEGELLAVSNRLGAPVPSLCRVDDRRLVAGTYNGALIGLEATSLAEVGRGAPHEGSVKSLVPFAGGFASAATDRTLAVGSLRDRSVLWEHGNLVNAVATLDDRIVATVSRDHTVKVGLVERGDDGEGWQVVHRQTLLGPDESVKCVSLLGDPDSPVVLAGSYDFGVYRWRTDWAHGTDLASGRLVDEFRQGVSCMHRIDARRVAVAGWDGQILVVGLDAAGEVRVLRRFDVDMLVRRARQAVWAVAS
ncbi:WD40 repeat domain-containing protein [Streptomyces sp. G1]|uniref:WD40 repeat domain-containing protein n=1 Tax=Streptomyces sp. G1 TaxID=361572 RepID=UPI00202FE0BC|nr:WD40 repeat domain-containing protein [Streptomyces sp. G1]MCM1973055.1 WD40 repeat domain-containing protein [Streptomyces sp. G1]